VDYRSTRRNRLEALWSKFTPFSTPIPHRKRNTKSWQLTRREHNYWQHPNLTPLPSATPVYVPGSFVIPTRKSWQPIPWWYWRTDLRRKRKVMAPLFIQEDIDRFERERCRYRVDEEIVCRHRPDETVYTPQRAVLEANYK
jgi:hypothetical protein